MDNFTPQITLNWRGSKCVTFRDEIGLQVFYRVALLYGYKYLS
jgi:hypothetical protein